jgi:predicted O-methyltransferase YrrM
VTFAEIVPIVHTHTILSPMRLAGLYSAVRHAVDDGIPGDLVECGCCRGGSAAMMALACDRSRRLWAFDSFAGMPPSTADDPADAMEHTGGCCVGIEEVQTFLAGLGVLNNGTLVKGWFRDTFPKHEVKQIAVLHVDCDWHDSVKLSLETFYDLVSPGGIIQIDDYGHWSGARKAVDDFFRVRGIDPKLKALDYTGVQHVKER